MWPEGSQPTVTEAVPFVATDAHRLHDPTIEVAWGAPIAMYECVERGDRIEAAVRSAPGFEQRPTAERDDAEVDRAIDAVHDPDLREFLANGWSRFQREAEPRREVFPDVMLHPAVLHGMDAPRRPHDIAGELGWWCWETNTPIVEGTFDAARAAVDVALSTIELVVDGHRLAYGLCRPPGHHAPRAAYGGYCYFNNAAIAAQRAVEAGMGRVAIIDVDYHHGNGSQQIFWDRDDVTYASLHGDPRRAYPYFCGHRDEIGGPQARGATINRPLPAGTDDAAYAAALAEVLERVDDRNIDLIVVSLGVDTTATDPLGDFRLTPAGLHACGREIARLGRPMVVLQEGGYDLETVGDDVVSWLDGASGAARVFPDAHPDR